MTASACVSVQNLITNYNVFYRDKLELGLITLLNESQSKQEILPSSFSDR